MRSLVFSGDCSLASIRIERRYFKRSVSSIFDTLASSRG